MSLRSPSVRLRQAVQDDDLSLVMRLRSKTDLRNTDTNRLTSLAYAALYCAEEVFEWLLLDAGHDEEELSRDTDNSTILHMLASLPAPVTPKKKKVAEIHKAAVRMCNMYWDAFPYLMDWSNAGGKTALHIAAQSGNVEFVKTLCELGADLNLPDLQGNTPLHYASAWNQMAVIHTLISFPDCHISLRNNSNFTALDYSYSNELLKEFSAAIKEVYEDRRSRRLQQSHTPILGHGRPDAIRDGSFVSVESSGKEIHRLRSRGSMGTLLSEDSAGGNRSDLSYNGRNGSGQGTPPSSGLITPAGLNVITQSPSSLRIGLSTPQKTGEGAAYNDKQVSPSMRNKDTFRPPPRSDSFTNGQQQLLTKARSESFRSMMEQTPGNDTGLASQMARAQIGDGEAALGEEGYASVQGGRPTEGQYMGHTSPSMNDGADARMGLGIGPVPPPRRR